jgi:hypothetical protein
MKLGYLILLPFLCLSSGCDAADSDYKTPVFVYQIDCFSNNALFLSVTADAINFITDRTIYYADHNGILNHNNGYVVIGQNDRCTVRTKQLD